MAVYLVNLQNIFSNILRDYYFSIFFILVVLGVSVPFNLLMPKEAYCTPGLVSNLAVIYVHLTAPFNIGCEAPLTAIWTNDGINRIFSNLFLAFIYVIVAESALNRVYPKYKLNVFFASILAAYGLSIGTFFISGRFSVGTSIISLSMLLTTTLILLYGAWQNRQKVIIFVFLFVLSVSLFLWTFSSFSAENPEGHFWGGVIFIIVTILSFCEPNWLDKWKTIFYHIRQMF